jgi:hypothetical protein
MITLTSLKSCWNVYLELSDDMTLILCVDINASMSIEIVVMYEELFILTEK